MSVGLSAIRRAATSFGTIKLNNIIGDLKYDADELAKMALIMEAKKAKREYLHAGLERDEAGLERAETREERQEREAVKRVSLRVAPAPATVPAKP